ncbi:hypothetical protein PI125_g25339 [Phytophthora idaei]|nr:hypothetical protein PI125_g25339 [Phytophthora idaei]
MHSLNNPLPKRAPSCHLRPFFSAKHPSLSKVTGPTSLVNRPTENRLRDNFGMCHTFVSTPFFMPRGVFIDIAMSPVPTA